MNLPALKQRSDKLRSSAAGRLATLKQRLRAQAKLLFSCLAVLWLVRGVDAVLLGGRLVQWGIHPRTLQGLLGVLIAPFVHAGWRHLMANSLPFLILGWLVLLRGKRSFVTVTVATALVSGLGVWAIGASSTTHVGVSGVIFGYFGFLLGRAYYERSLMSLLVGLVVIMLYGSLIWSVFPTQQDVSWEGHLFGGLAGVVCARILADPRYRLRA